LIDINFKYYSIDTIYIKTKYKQLLADTITPVSLYFKIRDKFPNSLLLESSDYHNDNSFSYICCNQSHQKIENEIISKQFPDGTAEQIKLTLQLIFDCYSRVFWPI
jgi:anthranilate synthase component 1